MAGSSQAGGESYFTVEEIVAFSKKVEKSMAENRAKVAIVGRVGRPRKDLPDGIIFTHIGFAVYSKITTEDGRSLNGYAMYNLYQTSDDQDASTLVQDYPVDFFAGVQVLEAGIIIPSPELQTRLLEILSSDLYSGLHESSYSAIANPYSLGYQNCTEFVTDILFAAIYDTDNIKQIKKNQRAYFEAQTVNVSPLKLMLGSVFAEDITTADHPGKPETATFTTIGNFLEKFDLASHQYIVPAVKSPAG
jgi:hypothetical protein